MTLSRFVPIGILAASIGYADGAGACGGCFVASSAADSLVTGHRMAFAISESRTVLWDQIKFTGDPDEFGWVLPIKPGAYVEESNDAWFEALETVTAIRVASPQITCQPPSFAGSGRGSGCGCGSEDSVATSAPASGGGLFGEPVAPPLVTVVHQGTVGAFETVTLSSDDGSALRTWLTDHGYRVPAEVEPVIDTYVAEGADFIALRLVPGRGVSEMTPVRVVTPGGGAILPLRMVAAGTGIFTDIVLYVIGEGRFDLKDLTEAKVKLGELTFDFAINESNYGKLRESALGENTGFSFITAFSMRSAFSRTYAGGVGTLTSFVDTRSNSYVDFTSLYFGQANVNNGGVGSSNDPCSQAVLGRLAADQVVGSAPDGGLVPSGPDGGSGGGSGAKVTGPMALDYVCDGNDDIAAAVIGMRPDQIWVSRLEMNLPREALTMDCNVGLAPSQELVSAQLRAPKIKNPPCPNGVITGDVSQSFANSTSTCVWLIGSLLSLVAARRYGRRDVMRR